MYKLLGFFEKHVSELWKNKFFLITTLGTLLEFTLFVLLLSSGTGTSINLRTAFFGVPPVLIYISFALLPYSLGFLFKGRGQNIFFIIINLLISLLLIFDLWYYRSNSTFMNYYMFDMTANLEGLSSSILAMFRPVDLSFLAVFSILLLLFIKKFFYYKENKTDLRKFLLVFLIPLAYLTYAHIKIDKLHGGYEYETLFRRTWSQNQMMFSLSPLGYHLFDYYNYREDKKPYKLSEEEQKKIDDYYASKERNLPENSYSGIFKGKNLIVIQVESMENFIINEKIGNEEITPNLNKLLKNSLYFSNYHEQTLNGTTSDATFVSNTSMFPTLNGNNNFNFPYNTYNSLPKLLTGAGYSTYSMHGEKGTYWNWKTAEKNLGFQNTIDISEFNEDEIIGLGLSDKTFLSQAAEKIAKEKQPFYTFMITLSSHSPFYLPKQDITINIPDYLKGTKTGGFIEGIHYTDAMIGSFMASLEQKGLLDNTVVAIYGDHEGIHKFFGEEVQNLNIPDKWKENDRRIPLLIYSKDFKGSEIKVNGGQVDFLPTMSYLLGINQDEYQNTALGRNLLNTKLDYTVLSNFSYRGKELSKDEEKKYIDVLRISNSMTKANYFKGKD